MRETRKLKSKWSKMIKTNNNHELVKGVLSAYQNPLYNETDEHRIVAWLTVLICCDSFYSIKPKVFKPRRVQIPLGDRGHVCLAIQDGVEKLERCGFGSLPAGYHTTRETEKRH